MRYLREEKNPLSEEEGFPRERRVLVHAGDGCLDRIHVRAQVFAVASGACVRAAREQLIAAIVAIVKATERDRGRARRKTVPAWPLRGTVLARDDGIMVERVTSETGVQTGQWYVWHGTVSSSTGRPHRIKRLPQDTVCQAEAVHRGKITAVSQ